MYMHAWLIVVVTHACCCNTWVYLLYIIMSLCLLLYRRRSILRLFCTPLLCWWLEVLTSCSESLLSYHGSASCVPQELLHVYTTCNRTFTFPMLWFSKQEPFSCVDLWLQAALSLSFTSILNCPQSLSPTLSHSLPRSCTIVHKL